MTGAGCVVIRSETFAVSMLGAAADRDEPVDLSRASAKSHASWKMLDRGLDARAVIDDDLDALGSRSPRGTWSGSPSAAMPGSVTSIARLTPRRLSSHPASAVRPGAVFDRRRLEGEDRLAVACRAHRCSSSQLDRGRTVACNV